MIKTRCKSMRISDVLSVSSILLVGILPPLVGGFFNASSMALGLLASFFVVFILNVKYSKVILSFNLIVAWLGLGFILYSALQHAFVGGWWGKSYISVILLFFYVSYAYFFSKIAIINNIFSQKNVLAVTCFCLVLVLIAIVTDFYFGIIFYDHHKSVFPFGEPSHFALFFGPFFILSLVFARKNWFRIFLVASIVLAFFLIKSATLAAYFFLGLVLFVRFSPKSLFLVLPVVAIFFYYLLNDDYFTSRINLDVKSENLTALVYLQGIQDSVYSFVTTHGLGLGFQMLGTQQPSPAHYQILYILGQDDGGSGLNRFDGGFLSAKIVSEFGVLGFLIICAYVFFLYKSFFKIRGYLQGRICLPHIYVFSLVFIYSSCVEFFVRGVGYFSPSLFFFLVATFVYRKFSKVENK